MSDSQQYSVFKTVFVYSIFILLAPIATFFAVKICLFEGVIGASTVSSNVWSAVAAVIVLHIGLGMYIMRAYKDAEKSKPSKDDKMD